MTPLDNAFGLGLADQLPEKRGIVAATRKHTRVARTREMEFDPARRRVVRALTDVRERLLDLEQSTLFNQIASPSETEQRADHLDADYRELQSALKDWSRIRRALTGTRSRSKSTPTIPVAESGQADPRTPQQFAGTTPLETKKPHD